MTVEEPITIPSISSLLSFKICIQTLVTYWMYLLYLRDVAITMVYVEDESDQKYLASSSAKLEMSLTKSN